MNMVKKAIKAAGGATNLADELKVSRAVIYLWKRVPAERLVDIERITRIPRERLRPELYRRSAEIHATLIFTNQRKTKTNSHRIAVQVAR